MSVDRTITGRSGGATGRLGRSLFAVTFGVLLAALVVVTLALAVAIWRLGEQAAADREERSS